jgi:hypothetical protein
MKFSAAVLATVAVAQDGDRKVPPRHPIQRLNRLVEFSAELLNDWYSFLPSQASWVGKFERNAERMERNFERGNQRCGFYDENQLPHGGPSERRKREIDSDSIWDRYDREDPSVGTKQITTGFRKWAERYLSECSGQRNYNYQVNRMNKWNGLLQDHLANNQE